MTNSNADIKLKERLKMFEEIDNMVKIDQLNPSNKVLKDQQSQLDNSNLYNYSDKINCNLDENFYENLNYPMQLNNINENSKNVKIQKYENLEKEKIKNNDNNMNYNNSNFPLSTKDCKFKIEPNKNNFINKTTNFLNDININELDNDFVSSNNQNLCKNSNYKNLIHSKYSSKSPQRKNDKIDENIITKNNNNFYDFPNQINIKKELIFPTTNINIRNNSPDFSINNFIYDKDKENPFKNNIIDHEKNFSCKNQRKDNNTTKIKKENFNSSKKNKFSYKSPIIKTISNQKLQKSNSNIYQTPTQTNEIKREIKKDFIECFDYDFYNFPFSKNISDSKIDKNNLNKIENILKDLEEKTYNLNQLNKNIICSNNSTDIKNNQIKKSYSSKSLINKNLYEKKTSKEKSFYLFNSNFKKKISTPIINNITNTSKNNSNSKSPGNGNINLRSRSHYSKRSNNKSKTSDLSKEKDDRDINELKILKRKIIYSKQKNLGDRLYRYNIYYDKKKKNVLEKEEKIRARSATPEITRKAHNLKRDQTLFHERLYPYKKINLFEEHKKKNENFSLNQKKTQNKNYKNIYENILNQKNFDAENIRSFSNKNFTPEKINFYPQLNKKSLNIAEKLGPASERLYSQNKKNKIYNIENSNTPKSDFSSFSKISKGINSPCVIKTSKNNTNHSNASENYKRQFELYQKGLDNMKQRLEKTNQKKLLEEEKYKNFSYRPIINSNFSPTINKIVKSPSLKNNNHNIKFDLEKFINSPSDDEYINSNDYTNFFSNVDEKELNNINKFNEIYEKNILWKQRIEMQTEKIKRKKEKIIENDLTFKPEISKLEIKNDEKIIQKNLNHMQNYVNKRRMNLKKKKDEEDFKKKKFSYGENFILKPTIPKEFNFNGKNNNCKINGKNFMGNLKEKNLMNKNKNNIQNLRTELKTENFFNEEKYNTNNNENYVEYDDFLNNKDSEQLFYNLKDCKTVDEMNINLNGEILEKYYNKQKNNFEYLSEINKNQTKNIKNNNYNKYNINTNNTNHNSNDKNQNDLIEKNKIWNCDKSIFNKYKIPNNKNSKITDEKNNQIFYNETKNNQCNSSKNILQLNQKNNTNEVHQDQQAFVNAISNIHDKLINLKL